MRIPSDPARFMGLPAGAAGRSSGGPAPAAASEKAEPAEEGGGFARKVTEALETLGRQQAEASRMVIDLATGQDVTIHDTMIAMEEAGLAFKLMVQVRNKALEAYQEVMRTQV